MTDRSSTDTAAHRARAYLVHLFTASGVVFAFLATAEVIRATPDPRLVFLWLALANMVDALDGPLARRWHVKTLAPRISGRTIDDIIDYLTFTFIPLLLVWRLDWLAGPAALWVVLAMFASVLGFANTGAKQEEDGFFLGFPSYWNIFAYYAGLWAVRHGTLAPAVLLVLLAILTVTPVRFVYPNRAPHPWRRPVLWGAVIWLALLLAMLPTYPAVADWLLWLSLVYPVFYALISVYLDVRTR